MVQLNVDRILLQFGQFGRFQFFNYIAISLPIMISSMYSIAYVFEADDLQYRCLVPECEGTGDVTHYLPNWLPNAVPYEDGKPSACQRFAPQQINSTAGKGKDGICDQSNFSKDVENCHRFLYASGQRSSILDEWDLTCDNKWKLSFVGTANQLGQLFGMPLSGIVSDRFGRKQMLFWGWTASSLMGLIRSFSTSYEMFISLEFLSSFMDAGVYGAGFLLALEFVGPQYRVFAGTVLVCFYSVGEVILGGIAAALYDWRWYLRAVYILGLACLPIMWPAPESIRWLASQGRYSEADQILEKVALVNKVKVKDTVQGAVKENYMESEESDSQEVRNCCGESSLFGDLLKTLKSRPLLLRFINLSYCWMANTFVYYGLSLFSVALAGNEYVNFILTSLVETPANFAQYWLLNKCGRRFTQSATMIVAGICCLSFLGVSDDIQWLRLTLYMLGKFCITISFDAVYVYTAELFPTQVRNSVLSACSTFGRIGSSIAPQAPLLATVSESLPLALFGGASLLSGLLAVMLPETKDRPLPESIEEAVALGKSPPANTEDANAS